MTFPINDALDHKALTRLLSFVLIVILSLHPDNNYNIDKQQKQTTTTTSKEMTTTTTTSSPTERFKLLLLGDSLTQTAWEGWGGGLAHRYQRRADILNRGMSGYNTRWYLKYAETSGIWNEVTPSSSVKLVTIFFGANDASLEKENPHHHVPLEEYSTNLKTILNLVKTSYPDAKILFITPPPVHHGQRLIFQKERYKEKATGILERTLESAGKYADACMKVAKETDTPYLDLYNLMKGDSDGNDEGSEFGKYFYDGLHFSKEGHDFVTKHLLEAIEKHFPSIHVTPDPVTGQENNSGSKCEGIPSSGPYHDLIDHTAWEKEFEITVNDEPDAKRSKTEE